MQHSTPEMKIKLLMMDLWAQTSTAQDRIVLLKTIRDISLSKKTAAPTPPPSLTSSRWTRKCSLSTNPRPNPYRATYQGSKEPLTLAICLIDPPGHTLPLQNFCTTNCTTPATIQQTKTATQATTKQQPQRLRGNTSLRYSSTASATKSTGTSRKKSTTKP